MLQDVIGYLGGIFIMVSFVPQVIKSYKNKKREGYFNLDDCCDFAWHNVLNCLWISDWKQTSCNNECYFWGNCYIPINPKNQI
ncbi:PQ-loop repeat-containing protein [Candidatus Woesearchaeota archaeon]|nr:PQ-loop repeat-containing protein [Candidatus Woesearchaeota archaeon]